MQRCLVLISALVAITLLVGIESGCRRSDEREPEAGKPSVSKPLPPLPGLAMTRALQLAEQCADAIKDPKRKGTVYQEKVARAHLDRGDLKRAVERAREIPDYRGGTVLADAAAKLAGHSDALARAILEEADASRVKADGWRAHRIETHMLRARALLIDMPDTAAMRRRMADEADQLGRISMAEAISLARAGKTEQAKALLEGLAAKGKMDMRAWQSEGYAELIRLDLMPADELERLVDRAWRSSDLLPAARGWHAKMDLIDWLFGVGQRDAAVARLKVLTPKVVTSPSPPHMLVAPLTRLAVLWGHGADAAEVETLAADVDPMIEGNLQRFQQPAPLAAMGAAFALVGRTEDAVSRFAAAVDKALEHPNRRIRAMSGVEICLALDECGIDEVAVWEAVGRLLDSIGVGNG